MTQTTKPYKLNKTILILVLLALPIAGYIWTQSPPQIETEDDRRARPIKDLNAYIDDINSISLVELSIGSDNYAADIKAGEDAARAVNKEAFLAEVEAARAQEVNAGKTLFYLERDAGLADLKEPELMTKRQYYWANHAATLNDVIDSRRYGITPGRCFIDVCLIGITVK